MADLITDEPSVIVSNLLQSEWNGANIDGSFDAGKRISTGWWSEDSPHPQITVTPVDEDTSPTGLDPSSGGLTSWVSGSLDCNVWVANDYDSTGGVHPRTLRWQLRREVQRIIMHNQQGTTTDSGDPELTRLETGVVRGLVETDSEPVVYRYVVPVGYVWHARP